MRLEATGKPDQYKVWLRDDELDELRRAAGENHDDFIVQFGGFVGLRAFEIPQVIPRHVKRTPEGDHFRLRVPEGKDTTCGGGKPREAYLPNDVEDDIHRYVISEKIGREEPIVGLSVTGVRAAVKRTGESAAETTGDENFLHVSSHGLRRRFAQRLLVDKQVNSHVVMRVGGWDCF